MFGRKNNKGFSLVELLAAIVIMGILTGIGIVSVTYLINKTEKEYYKAQESEIIMAAKSYTQDNRSFLPNMQISYWFKRCGELKDWFFKFHGEALDVNFVPSFMDVIESTLQSMRAFQELKIRKK